VGVVRQRLRADDAVAFVHAGSDAHCTYLGSDAVVVTSDAAVRLVERGSDAASAGREGERTPVDVRSADDPAGAVVDVVDELVGTPGDGTVLTPRTVRHDAALFLERAGYDLTSTTALDDARAVKTPAERDAVRTLGTAATRGFDTAVEHLATADVGDGVLQVHDADSPLTVGRLARAVSATLAGEGVETPGVRVRSAGADALAAGRPVVVECCPVGPSGERLRAAWTLVVDGDGGWERRAQLALAAAHRAGRGRLAAALDGETVTGGDVASEVRAEVTAYGFEQPSVSVGGVGQAVRERPRGGEELRPGQVVVVAVSVARDGDETVSDGRRTDVVRHVETLCLDDGVERVVTLPGSLSPSRALDSA
jgi:Xaa-Pro aminopeptidase